jgi:glycogen phosphorylase
MKDSMNSSPPSEMDASDALTRLALDLSWSWNHSTDEIWKRLDPELRELTGHPWLILQSISRRKLDSVSDTGFHA